MAEFDLSSITVALSEAKDSGVSFSGKASKWENLEAASELIEAIDACKTLDFLDLEGNTLGVEAANGIGEALKKHPEMKRALWKDLFTGRLKTEIPQALKAMGAGMIAAGAHLEILDCSDNALGPNGMVGLVDLLKSPTCYSLKELRLNNCGLGIQGGKMLAKALLDCHASSTAAGTPLQLRVFIAGRNRLENEGAKALAKVFGAVKSLEEVAMPQNGIYHEGISALSEGFRQNVEMRILNLNDNTIRERGASALSDAFYSMQKLQDINFGDCLLKTKGALYLSEALQDAHKELHTLNLGYNEIKAEGGLSIAAAMHNKVNLKSLCLDSNQFGHDGCEQIQEMLSKYDLIKALTMEEDESAEEDEDEDDNSGDSQVSGEEDEEDDNDGEWETENEDEQPTIVNVTTGTDDSQNNSVLFVGEEERPRTVATFIDTPYPSVDMFNSITETDKLAKFREVLGMYKEEDYTTKLVFAVLKCSALSFSCPEAATIAHELYRDSFEHAEKTSQMTRVKNFFLIQLGMLKTEDKLFSPTFNVEACRNALSGALAKNVFPEDVNRTFTTFMQRFYTNGVA